MSNFSQLVLSHQTDKIAIVDDVKSITYNELSMSIKKYANYLKSVGIAPGDKIVIAMPDSIEWCVAFLGSCYIGAVAVIVSAKTPPDKIKSIKASLYLTSPTDVIESTHTLERHHDYTDNEIGFYLTTSGTTGRQKYIVHHHRSLINYYDIVTQPFEVDHTSVIFSSPRLSFGYGLGVNIVLGLGLGATIILTDKILSSKLLGQKINKYNISHFFSTPVFLSSLVKHPSYLKAIGQLKVVTSAGEPMSRVIKEQFLKLYNKHVLNGYGLSEVLSYVSTQTPSDAETLNHQIIGKPIRGIEINIKNGELYVKHPCVAVGYLDENSDTFQANWVKTNDLVELNDQGELVYISRKDNLIKINSLYVSIDEVEDAILQHTDVEECLVYAKPNDLGLMELESNIVSSKEITPGELRRFLSNILESHKIPKRFHSVAQISKTLTAKKIRNTFFTI